MLRRQAVWSRWLIMQTVIYDCHGTITSCFDCPKRRQSGRNLSSLISGILWHAAMEKISTSHEPGSNTCTLIQIHVTVNDYEEEGDVQRKK